MWNNKVMFLVQEHLALRPQVEPRDVYKLLYQGVMGPEHIISSPQAFTDRLRDEWENLPIHMVDDPLWEPVRPNRGLLRLNLRPFKAVGGSLDKLVTVCLEIAQHPWGTLGELQTVWSNLMETCRTLPLPGLFLTDLETFTAWLNEQGFPPVHHSETYRNAYRPAYRLVAACFSSQ
jgi:hypothetical protein